MSYLKVNREQHSQPEEHHRVDICVDRLPPWGGSGFLQFWWFVCAPTSTFVKLFENSGAGCTRSAAGSRLGVLELPKIIVCVPGAAVIFQWTVGGFFSRLDLEL